MAKKSVALLLLCSATLAFVPSSPRCPSQVASGRASIGETTLLAQRKRDQLLKLARRIGLKRSDGDAAVALAPAPEPEARIGRDERTPPVLSEEICLMPGQIIIRVEDAPGNARRVFAGIDVLASVDKVWDMLTDYAKLQDVVPNLVSNDVVQLYSADADDEVLPAGARLRQVGAAKLMPGINFKASLTLDVREWAGGMPDRLVAQTTPLSRGDEVESDESEPTGNTEDAALRAFNAALPLERGIFPRPFAYSSLPARDISMQSVEGVRSDFSLYQGVWRLQPLTSCAPDGTDAMRLTYAVELRPSLPVPVRLLEGRIARDLTENMQAVRRVAEMNSK